MRLQILNSDSSLIIVRVVPTERQELAYILETMRDGELTLTSDKGIVRFARGTSNLVEARDLFDINFALTDDVIRYLADAIAQHACEEQYHPFNCGLRELGADIHPRSKNIVIQATSFIDVRTQAELNAFYENVGHFHDAVIRELAVVSHSYVGADGWMHNDRGPADARFVIHTQFPGPAVIEIVMEEIQALHLDASKLPEVGLIGIIKEDGSLISGNRAKRGSEMVVAKSMRYRILGRDFLGKRLRAVSTEIIGQTGTMGTNADVGWSISPPNYPEDDTKLR